MAMASPNNKALERYKSAVTVATSVVGAAMLLRRLISDILPGTALGGLLLLPPASARRHVVLIEEFDGALYNRVFLAARAYVSTLLAAAPSVPLMKASLPRGAGAEQVLLAMRPGTAVVDAFGGADLTWRLSRKHDGSRRRAAAEDAREVFKLSFEARHKDMVLGSYLPAVMARAEAMSQEQRQSKLYSNEWGKWRTVRLRNASTLATVAMDGALREAVVEDLDRFLTRKEYYRQTGRAWKRGYLIHGPPGTGKSSLVAAISNHLHFDVYDLDIGGVRSNTELRKLLIRMKNRSILLVEDVDCALTTAPRRDANGEGPDGSSPASKNHKVTLSGLLNMVDGLWSSSGQERILIFTTNHKDRLDQALLRPGRMDRHVHMGYCGFVAFRELAANYHGVHDHPLFAEIEELLCDVEVAPAEVAEKLLATDDADAAVEMAVKLLRDRKAGTGEDAGGYIKQKLHVGPRRPRRQPAPAPRRGVVGSARRVVLDEEVGGSSRRAGRGSGTARRGRGGVRGRGRR
ncbi:AAA-ATPase At3g50940-like [Lolium rigidum]|uniref:AAA-ATPase At3g50940-like n=1 Tax=Lolium rigidum TaxID=89674 RepID=UPI001F5E0E2E|nr:AAA-ATPase At3g50940-like [Lolium rigidum]